MTKGQPLWYSLFTIVAIILITVHCIKYSDKKNWDRIQSHILRKVFLTFEKIREEAVSHDFAPVPSLPNLPILFDSVYNVHTSVPHSNHLFSIFSS